MANTFARFLLARLHVDSLLDKRTKGKVLQTLNSLTKGTKALEDAYHEAIIRIDSQLPEDSTLAKKVLSWISYAQRPLTGKELCHASAVELEDEELNTDNVLDIEDIVPVCAGLVLIDEESQIIRLVHYTTQEYLETIRETWDSKAQYQIAATCLTYLCFRAFRSGPCKSYMEFETRLAQYPFLVYAARHWAWHVAGVQEQARELAMGLFRQPQLITAIQQACIDRRLEYDVFYDSIMFTSFSTSLHLVASAGLRYLSQQLLDSAKANMKFADSKDSQGNSPLSLAVMNGHLAVSELLVGKDHVNIDGANHKGITPLMNAAGHGHSDLTRLLLDSGKININRNDSQNGTALTLAIEKGSREVVEMLLSTGKIDANKRYGGKGTAMAIAARHGHEAILRLLLDDREVDVNAKDFGGDTALMWSAERGHKQVFQLLLDTGRVEIDAKNKDGYTALMYAASNGHEEILKLLLDTSKADINAKNKRGGTALTEAISIGKNDVVRILLAEDGVHVYRDAAMKAALESSIGEIVDLIESKISLQPQKHVWNRQRLFDTTTAICR